MSGSAADDGGAARFMRHGGLQGSGNGCGAQSRSVRERHRIITSSVRTKYERQGVLGQVVRICVAHLELPPPANAGRRFGRVRTERDVHSLIERVLGLRGKSHRALGQTMPTTCDGGIRICDTVRPQVSLHDAHERTSIKQSKQCSPETCHTLVSYPEDRPPAEVRRKGLAHTCQRTLSAGECFT